MGWDINLWFKGGDCYYWIGFDFNNWDKKVY
jgi:hypothetical protein